LLEKHRRERSRQEKVVSATHPTQCHVCGEHVLQSGIVQALTAIHQSGLQRHALHDVVRAREVWEERKPSARCLHLILLVDEPWALDRLKRVDANVHVVAKAPRDMLELYIYATWEIPKYTVCVAGFPLVSVMKIPTGDDAAAMFQQ